MKTVSTHTARRLTKKAAFWRITIGLVRRSFFERVGHYPRNVSEFSEQIGRLIDIDRRVRAADAVLSERMWDWAVKNRPAWKLIPAQGMSMDQLAIYNGDNPSGDDVIEEAGLYDLTDTERRFVYQTFRVWCSECGTLLPYGNPYRVCGACQW